MTIGLESLPQPIQKFINTKLENEERVLWLGQPIMKLNSIWKIALAYLVGIVLILFPAFLIYSGIKYHNGLLIIGIIAAVIFFYIAYALLLWPKTSIENQRSTVYLVTSKRAIVVVPARPFSLVTVTPNELRNYTISENPNGTGDIILKKMFVRNVGKGGYELTNAFLNIKEVKVAEAAIKQLLAL